MPIELKSVEELSARFVQLVRMSAEDFCGHEDELAEINGELWDTFGNEAPIHIERAREAYSLLGGDRVARR
jgi:hypothetical protein